MHGSVSSNGVPSERRKKPLTASESRRLHTNARLLLRAPLYRGSSVACPCCGRSFRRFAAEGRRGTDGPQCPRCGAWETHRLLWLFIEQWTDLFWHAWSVLEVAREPFFAARIARLRKRGYVRCHVVTTNASGIPDDDARFDRILWLDAGRNGTGDATVLDDMSRILKPGGWALVRGQRKTSLEDTDLVVEVIPFGSHLGDEACTRFGLDSSASIWLASKPQEL